MANSSFQNKRRGGGVAGGGVGQKGGGKSLATEKRRKCGEGLSKCPSATNYKPVKKQTNKQTKQNRSQCSQIGEGHREMEN